jgi:hypothetical protein
VKTWLWPNRTIGKAESGVLREEHNAAVNENAELLVAASDAVASLNYAATVLQAPSSSSLRENLAALRAAIAKAEGGGA